MGNNWQNLKSEFDEKLYGVNVSWEGPDKYTASLGDNISLEDRIGHAAPLQASGQTGEQAIENLFNYLVEATQDDTRCIAKYHSTRDYDRYKVQGATLVPKM